MTDQRISQSVCAICGETIRPGVVSFCTSALVVASIAQNASQSHKKSQQRVPSRNEVQA
jgi:hypothetical protein